MTPPLRRSAFASSLQFRAPVTWKGKQAIENINGPIRVRINWLGDNNVAQLFATYVE